MEALPVVGRAAGAARRHRPGRQRRDRRRRAGPGRLPVHAAGLPGPRDRLGAQRAAAQRRRLGPGAAGADRRRAGRSTATRTCRRDGADRARRATGVGFAYGDAAGAGRRLASRRSRGGRSRWSVRPARASPRSPRCSCAWSTRPPARSASTASTCASSRRARWPRWRPWYRSRPSCSTTPSAATSRSAPTSTTSRSGRRCAPPRPTASSRRCRTGSTPGSASAGPRCPAGSGSGSRWPGRVVRRAPAAGARRRDQRRSTRRWSSGSWAGCATSAATVVVVAYRRATIALADEIVFVDQGRVVDRGTHDELMGRCAGYRDLVTAYAAGRGRAGRGARRRRAGVSTTTLERPTAGPPSGASFRTIGACPRGWRRSSTQGLAVHPVPDAARHRGPGGRAARGPADHRPRAVRSGTVDVGLVRTACALAASPCWSPRVRAT